MELSNEVGAWAALLRVRARLVTAFDAELRSRCGLPLAWYDVFLALNQAPGRRLRMSELAAEVVVSRTRVSRIVDEMHKEGLVDREPDPDDRRSSFAVLSAAGRARLREAAPVYLAAIERDFASHLTPAEARTVRRALERILSA